MAVNKIVDFSSLEEGLKEVYKDIKSKEPIIIKKTGFNLDKTDLTENDPNKLFTPCGALNLKNWLVSNYTFLMNNIKENLDIKIESKLPHGGYSGTGQALKKEIDNKFIKRQFIGTPAARIDLNNLKEDRIYAGYCWENSPYNDTSTQIATINIEQYSNHWLVQKFFDIQNGRDFFRNFVSNTTWTPWYEYWTSKNFNPETKLDKINSWKIEQKTIGNTETPLDLNNIYIAGYYKSGHVGNKFINLPASCSNAFELIVTGINPSAEQYTTQKIKEYNSNKIWTRTNTDGKWGKWCLIWNEDNFNPNTKQDKNDTTLKTKEKIIPLAINEIGYYLETGANYIYKKYFDGTLHLSMRADLQSDTNNIITFPISFINTEYFCSSTVYNNNYGGTESILSKRTNGITMRRGTSPTSGTKVELNIIGRWK